MGKRNPFVFALTAFLALCLGAVTVPLYPQKKTGNEQTQDKGVKSEGLSVMHKRLAEAIANLRTQPDSEGKFSFALSSGSRYDTLEAQKYVYNLKADVYMSQGRVSKIVFVYYQFGMTNQIREVKSLTNGNPSSDDLGSLEVNYETNTGETRAFKVGDLQSSHSRDEVISQYASYLDSLVNYVEIHMGKRKSHESGTIERAIQLGK